MRCLPELQPAPGDGGEPGERGAAAADRHAERSPSAKVAGDESGFATFWTDFGAQPFEITSSAPKLTASRLGS
jgi:hypothetical protein